MGNVHWSPLCCLGPSCALSTERRLPHACELFSSALREMAAASAQNGSADIPDGVLRGILSCPRTGIPAGLGHRRGQRRMAGATLTPILKSGNRVTSLEAFPEHWLHSPVLGFEHQRWREASMLCGAPLWGSASRWHSPQGKGLVSFLAEVHEVRERERELPCSQPPAYFPV